MPVPRKSVPESERLAALVRYAILDTPPEAAFDRLTRLATRIFATPMALLSLVDEQRQWFKSKQGLDVTETARDISFCAHAIERDEPLVVLDATQDPRFAQSPLVTAEPKLRFYAGAPLRTSDGHTLGTFCVLDTTSRTEFPPEHIEALEDLARLAMEEMERRRAGSRILELESRLRASEARFHAFLDHAPAVAFLKDADGRMLYVNKTFTEVFGGTAQRYLGKDDAGIWPAAVAAELRAHDAALLKEDASSELLEQIPGPDGQMRHWLTQKFVVTEPDGTRLIGGVAVDLTEREQAKAALRTSEERWQLAAEGANDGLFDYDVRTGTVYYSPRWKELLGYADDELPNSSATWERLLHPEDRDQVERRLADHWAGRTPRYVAEYRMRAKDGTWRWVLARGKSLCDQTGRPVRMVGSHTDITARKQHEQQLAAAALTDSLTGLANRRSLDQQLARTILRCEENQEPLCLALGDVDLFKRVNDTYGHEWGDEVLVRLAAVLADKARPGDLVCRMGGDEFCVVLPGATVAEAAAVLERVRWAFAATPFVTSDGARFQATCSFGLASSQPGWTARQLLSRADEALYAAKREGRNRIGMDPNADLMAIGRGTAALR